MISKSQLALFLGSCLIGQLNLPGLAAGKDDGKPSLQPTGSPKSTNTIDITKRLDLRRLWVLSVGIHKFEADHLHGGREAVVTEDIGLIDSLMSRGVPANQIVALRDEQATTANCISQLKNLTSQAKPGDALLLFIHSHGSLKDGGLVCTYETGGTWKYTDIIQQIEDNFAGSHAILCVGACHSGSLLNDVGAKPRRVAYFGVTSVSADRNAWTNATADFEACIRDAFDGSPCPDLNRDGVTTFDEFGKYISEEQSTLFGSQPSVEYTDSFDPQIVIGDAAAHEGELDCALVHRGSEIRGRVIKQQGNKVQVRRALRPAISEWLDVSDVSPLER